MGELINFLPLKRAGVEGLFEAGGLFERGRLTCNRGFTACALYLFYCSFRMLKLIHQALTQRYASNFFPRNLYIEITVVENKNFEC